MGGRRAAVLILREARGAKLYVNGELCAALANDVLYGYGVAVLFKLAMLGALAVGLMACTETGSQASLPPPPEPEVLFESGMFIERIVPDGAVIYLALTDRQRKQKSQIVRVESNAMRVLVEDEGIYGSIVAHDGLVYYELLGPAAQDEGQSALSLRRMGLDGAIETLDAEWELDSFSQYADGWLYGKTWGLFGSGWLWRMPAEGPYDVERFSNHKADESLNDFVIEGSSIWLSVDNCNDGLVWKETACTSRLERMELGPLDPPRTLLATEQTRSDEARIDLVRPSGTRAAYLFGTTLKLVDYVTQHHITLAEKVVDLFGVHEDAAIVRVLAFDESSELFRVPLDGSAPTSIVRVPPIYSSSGSAMVEGALLSISRDGHRLYRIPL
jgi:hypothetical protein